MKTNFTPHLNAKGLLQSVTHFNEGQKRFCNQFTKFISISLIMFLMMTGQEVLSQCNFASSFGSATINTAGTVVTISTCSFAGEYSTISGAVSGQTLKFTSGATDFITIRSGTSGGPVVAFGSTPLTFANTFTGTLFAHWALDAACGTQSTCRTTTVQCTSCMLAAPANDLCANALPIACGQTISASTSGATIDAVATCVTTLGTAPGVWYTFVGDGQATTFSLCGSTYDTKLAVFSGACTGLTCVTGNDDFCGLQSQVTLTATCGTIYFVLVTGFSTNSGAFTLVRTCVPPDPCTSIPVLACSIPVTASTCGVGAWNPVSGNCGFSTPGQERLYSFTPTTTGMHTLVVTAASGGFGDYLYKLSSGGCNNTGWICISDANSAESDVFGPLTAGTTYYILFDSEVTGSASQTFRIDCPVILLACATNPSPANGNATCPNTATTLSWTAAAGATSYDVYFGTAAAPPFVANTATTSYNAGTLAAGNYFWQIIPVYGTSGTATGCTIWTFSKIDNTAPTITCAANVTVNNTPGLCSGVVTYGSISGTDNCTAPALTLVSGPASGSTNPVGVYTIIYRATDGAGNSSTCSFTATVKDTQVPTISCPAAVTVQCASLVPASNIAGVITADNCGIPTVTFVSDVISNQTCANRYTLTRTYRSTDASGNSATCSQIITVFDNTAPTITIIDPLLQGVPNGGTFEVQCQGQNPNWDLPIFSAGSVSIADNCGGGTTVAFNEILQNVGNCAVNGYINLYRLNWTVTDACGNSSSANVYMKLVDKIPPVIHGVPADISVNCDEIPAPPTNIYATDDCLCACILTYGQSNPAPGCQNGQVIKRTWTAKDDCGNQAVAIQNITLIDNKGPELQVTQPEIAGAQDGAIFEYTCNEGGIPEFYDHMSAGSVYVTPSCGTAQVTFDRNQTFANNCDFWGYIEQKKLHWDGVDQCGNKTSLTIYARLVDHEAPVLIGVPDIICMDDPALKDVDATDNCGHPSIRYWDLTVPNPCGNGFAVHRTYEAYDDCGNITRDTAILIPNDHTHPNLKFVNPLLANLQFGEILIIECSGSEDAYSRFGPQDAVVQDGCSVGTTIYFKEKITHSGSCVDGVLAVLELEWSSTDICGNLTIESVTAHVVDHTPPVLLNFKSEVSIGCNDALPEVGAKDNCGEVVMTTTQSIVPGGCMNQYDIVRVITAQDPCGNTTTQSQTIHVGNSNGPIISGVQEEICDNLFMPNVTAYDPCSEQYVQVTMTQDTMQTSCRDGYVIERTWSAADACGHISHAQQRIIVGDHTPPEIQIPSYSVIRNFLDNGYSLVYLSQKQIVERLNDLDESSISVQDDCDRLITPDFNVEVSYADNCQADGYYERRHYSWIATDLCGNVSELSFSVDIMDDIAPVFINVPESATYICQQLPGEPFIQTDDPAGPVSIEYAQSINPGVGPGAYDVVRLWVATDACGNSSSAEQHISWIPDTFLSCDIFLPPSVSCNTHGVPISSGLSGGLGGITYSWEVLGEECFIQSGQGTNEIQIYIGFTPVDILLHLADAYGCSTVCATTLECNTPAPNPIVGTSPSLNPVTISNPLLVNGTPKVDEAKSPKLTQLNLWPNPARGTVNVSFDADMDQEINFTLTNLMGQTMLIDKFNATKGYNTYKLDVAGIPEGSYMMGLKTSAEMYTKIVVVLRHE